VIKFLHKKTNIEIYTTITLQTHSERKTHSIKLDATMVHCISNQKIAP